MTQSTVWRAQALPVRPWDGPGEVVLAALQLLAGRARSEAVVVLGLRAALYYGLATRILGKRVPFVAKELLLDEGDGSAAHGVKRTLQRWALRDCDALIVYSEAERAWCSRTFDVPLERCHFIPFHTRTDPAEAPVPGPGPLLAAGRSLRDYETLSAAAKSSGVALTVIAPPRAAPHFRGIPSVTFLGEVSGDEYRRRLLDCRGVVVAVRAGRRSAGQAVLLESMGLGKPAVVTRTPGLVDYFVENETCVACEPGDVEGLALALRRLEDDSTLRSGLGAAALERAKRLYTPDAHAAAVLELARRAGKPA